MENSADREKARIIREESGLWEALVRFARFPIVVPIYRPREGSMRLSLIVTRTDIAASVNMLDAAPTVTSATGQGRIVRGRDAIKEEASKQIATLPQLKVAVGAIEVTRLGTTHAGLGKSDVLADGGPHAVGELGLLHQG
ncbi:MAG TPA: hypothetical protein VNP36_08295 [Burkholderiales bacterium]|nr:hypothetical protein [Burkholderiales bacterium]